MNLKWKVVLYICIVSNCCKPNLTILLSLTLLIKLEYHWGTSQHYMLLSYVPVWITLFQEQRWTSQRTFPCFAAEDPPERHFLSSCRNIPPLSTGLNIAGEWRYMRQAILQPCHVLNVLPLLPSLKGETFLEFLVYSVSGTAWKRKASDHTSWYYEILKIYSRWWLFSFGTLSMFCYCFHPGGEMFCSFVHC